MTQASLATKLGTYLNVAQLCEVWERPVDQAGALRRAIREFGGNPGGIVSKLDAILQRGVPLPDLPSGWSIVAFDRDEAGFSQLAGAEGGVFGNFWHPGAKFGGLLGTHGLEFLEQPQHIDNISFHVCFNGVLIATVPVVIDATHVAAWVTNHPAVGCMPIEVHFSDTAGERSEAYKVVALYLQYLARAYGATSFMVMEWPEEGFGLYRQIIKRAKSCSAEIWDRPYVDLEQEVSGIFSAVRKSYKSNINWCAKNLTVEYYSGEDVTDERMGYFYNVIQDLHQELIAKYGDGMTPDLFLQPILMCRNGQGEVAIAKTAEGVPYGMTVTTYAGGKAFYALAGSRILNGKNVGHFVTYDSILRAKAKGMRRYILNRFFGASVSLNQQNVKLMLERAATIIFFKRGFSDDSEFANVYQVFF